MSFSLSGTAGFSDPPPVCCRLEQVETVLASDVLRQRLVWTMTMTDSKPSRQLRAALLGGKEPESPK